MERSNDKFHREYEIPTKVAISGCYHAAKTAGLNTNQELVVDAIAKLRKFVDDLVEKIQTTGQNPPKNDALNIAAMVMLIALYSAVVHPTSTIRFRREWILDGEEFITTWTVGWYLQSFGVAT
eukprot:c7292_g1_i1.p1 GENE.c7292_g1_i1~~c7292_g1_i1.p1  ORF type:complete len:123 (-),score=32.34 c7292_g1_i1:68-436(-)